VSAPQVSSWIPDLNLITWYAERGGSFLSRASPWTKLGLLALVILAVTVTRSIIVLLGLYLAVLSLYLLAGLPGMRLAQWYFIPLFFVISLVGILAWTQPGTPVVSTAVLGIPLVLTDAGIFLVLSLGLRTLISVTCTLLVLMTTRYEHLAGMISRIFPSPLDQIFLMAYRFFFLTIEMAGNILRAFRSRGGNFVRGIRTEGRVLGEIIGLLFIRSFDRAERVRLAMEARGYRGTYASGARVPHPAAVEYMVMALAALALAAGLLTLPAGVW